MEFSFSSYSSPALLLQCWCTWFLKPKNSWVSWWKLEHEAQPLIVWSYRQLHLQTYSFICCTVFENLTFRTEAKRFIIKDSSLSSSSSKSNMGILKLSIILQHLEFSSLGSKGSTMIGSVPLISQRQKGQPWPSDSYRQEKKNV